MNVVKILIATDRVHIGIKSVSHHKAVAQKCQPFPLCQGVHHLCLPTVQRGNIKSNGTLVTVQIIVQTGITCNKQGRGHAL